MQLCNMTAQQAIAHISAQSSANGAKGRLWTAQHESSAAACLHWIAALHLQASSDAPGFALSCKCLCCRKQLMGQQPGGLGRELTQ